MSSKLKYTKMRYTDFEEIRKEELDDINGGQNKGGLYTIVDEILNFFSKDKDR